MPITFKKTPGLYALGRRVNAEEWNGVSRTSEGATPVGFGSPVVDGTGARGVLPLTAAGQTIRGICEASQVLPHVGDQFEQYDSMAVCESGVIAVQVGATAVTKNALARWDVTNKVWTAAAASSTVLTVPGATFETAGVANSLVPVRYRRPNPSIAASS